LGDHQHSTRVVLAHDFQDATYVRQSIDYAQFGRVTATLGANGLADATGVVTAFAHHGSLLDAATGLQQKGERWYSPDLGRFISEDPIQDGSNWYAFAGNDPVNSADPSGLSQQGHPLAGGYSGNRTTAPAMKSGFLPGFNLVDTATAVYRGAQAIAPYAKSAFNAGARALASTLLTAPPPVRRGVTLPLAPEAEEAVVRQITPGSAIVPRSIADLPGVRGALQEPGRYVIRNHNNIGYEVLNPDGSVRFIGDSNYLPITENYRRARVAAQAEAFRAGAIDLYSEALISFSPLHETSRDVGIGFGAYDYNNPNQQISSEQQRGAVTMLFMPGGNSGQVRKLDEFVDSVQDFRRAANNVVPHPNPQLSPTAPPQRVQGPWTQRDLERAAQGKGPLDLAPMRNRLGREVPLELHHADQMPGSAIHEMLPFHSNTPGAHLNKYNQGVTPMMRNRDAQLHWQMRGQEMGNPPPSPSTRSR